VRRHLLRLLLLLLGRPSLLVLVMGWLRVGVLTSAPPGVTCRRARQVLLLVVMMLVRVIRVLVVPNRLLLLLLLHVVCGRGIPCCMGQPLPLLLVLG
jgi:hypothetical protein